MPQALAHPQAQDMEITEAPAEEEAEAPEVEEAR